MGRLHTSLRRRGCRPAPPRPRGFSGVNKTLAGYGSSTSGSGIFLLCGVVAVGCVLLITVYLVISGIPAIREIGLVKIPLRQGVGPTAAEPQYGILPFILTRAFTARRALSSSACPSAF